MTRNKLINNNKYIYRNVLKSILNLKYQQKEHVRQVIFNLKLTCFYYCVKENFQ